MNVRSCMQMLLISKSVILFQEFYDYLSTHMYGNCETRMKDLTVIVKMKKKHCINSTILFLFLCPYVAHIFEIEKKILVGKRMIHYKVI